MVLIMAKLYELFGHDNQGLLGGLDQYFTIDKKSTVLNRRNTYFEDLFNSIESNPLTGRFLMVLFALALAIIVYWSVI